MPRKWLIPFQVTVTLVKKIKWCLFLKQLLINTLPNQPVIRR
ncbi:hypothetical protein BAZSYMA_ACONTIG03627_15 [Bathymodiolus azoricus thioautotrophic gill symbiont]|uniref:Uncharacterized protein n=1 Tax=Bathymodiolus azoricus thioautotrophic gill symbiont TaxID=235205 RepID=A0A1H6K1U8_9GAMM|nr:hypothetical protein BAZSYMA_ACONTIG03627_15 [Bathymodiolus azoricus thioautotrophic gill symbiont]